MKLNPRDLEIISFDTEAGLQAKQPETTACPYDPTPKSECLGC